MFRFKLSSPQIYVHLTSLVMPTFLVACMPLFNSSEEKILRGEVINGEKTNLVSAVALINQPTLADPSKGFGCTGTIVSTNTLITAAHCVNPPTGQQLNSPEMKEAGATNTQLPLCVKNAVYDKICSTNIYRHPDFVEDGMGGSSKRHVDIAVVVFDGQPFSHFMTLSEEKTLKIADEVLMVGYSGFNIDSSGKVIKGKIGLKRFGRNKVAEFKNGTIITEITLNDSNALIHPGDSGGPLFDNKCALRGIASGGLDLYAIHTPVTAHLEYLAKVQKVSKANYCGLPSQNLAGCPGSGRFYMNPHAAKHPKEFPCINRELAEKLGDTASGSAPNTPPTPPATSLEKVPTPSPQVITPQMLFTAAEKRDGKFYIMVSLPENEDLDPYLCGALTFEPCFDKATQKPTSSSGPLSKLEVKNGRNLYQIHVADSMVQYERTLWLFTIDKNKQEGNVIGRRFMK